MTAKQHARRADLLKQTDPRAILKAAALCDGHTLFKPEAFIEAGLPEELVKSLTTTHRSDGSPKGTIFVNGQPVTSLEGVYGLDVLRFIAQVFGIDYPSKIGRGFQAQALYHAIHQHFSNVKTPPEN